MSSLSQSNPTEKPTIIIEPQRGLQLIDFRELWRYRDLFFFLIWRSIKVRYAQSVLGISWAIIQPLFSMLVFTIVFGKLAKVSSDGVPYAIFSFAALVPWTCFSNSVVEGVNSLVSNANMLSKVYFPRILLPLSSVCAKLFDFAIASVVLSGLLIWFRADVNIGILMLPLLVLLMALTAAGISCWFTALAIQYRDVKHAIPFLVQLLLYAAPVVYSTNAVPEEYQLFYALNPMVGVIEGFRSALLSTHPMPWDLIMVGTISGITIFVSGVSYFRFKERVFADVA